MWDRKVLKSRAKFAMKRNYWKCVLVSLIITLFVGGGVGSGFTYQVNNSINRRNRNSIQQNRIEQSFAEDEVELENDNQISELFTHELIAVGIMFVVMLILGAMIGIAVAIVTDAFIFNPIEVGCDRFFFKNIEGPANVREIMSAFDNHAYRNVVNIMFWRDLQIVGWTLLLIIPGIVKAYEYMMIPYLLSENPNMTKEQAFAESRRMMSGQKMRAFVLDLSFLGWEILSLFTFGLLTIFYVAPYRNAAHAALYDALRYRPMNQQAAFGDPEVTI